jgi:hypothetical protein
MLGKSHPTFYRVNFGFSGEKPTLSVRLQFSSRTFTGIYFRSDHEWIFCPGILCCSNDHGITESSSAKLIQEGSTFLSARNSGKPVALRDSNFRRKRTLQNEFCGIGSATISQDSAQFAKDCLTLRVQIEYAINQGYINGSGWNWQMLGIRMTKFDVLDSIFGGCLSSPRQHGIAEIDTDNLSGRSDSLGGNQRIEPCAASEIEHHGPNRDICKDGYVRDSGKSINGYRWKAGKHLRGIAYALREISANGKRVLIHWMLRSLGINPANSIAELLI